MVKHNKVDGTKTKSRVGLIAMLATLVVAIVALVTIIMSINRDNDDWGEIDYSQFDDIAGREESTNEALSKCYDIRESFLKGNLTISEIGSQYEANMHTDDVVYNTYITVCYAQFIYRYGSSLDDAIRVAKLAEPLPNDLMVQISYYASMRDLYMEADDDERAEYYDQRVKRLLSFNGQNDSGANMIEEEE